MEIAIVIIFFLVSALLIWWRLKTVFGSGKISVPSNSKPERKTLLDQYLDDNDVGIHVLDDIDPDWWIYHSSLPGTWSTPSDYREPKDFFYIYHVETPCDFIFSTISSAGGHEYRCYFDNIDPFYVEYQGEQRDMMEWTAVLLDAQNYEEAVVAAAEFIEKFNIFGKKTTNVMVSSETLAVRKNLG